MFVARIIAFVAAAAACAAACIARADAPPIRHVVYKFTYEAREHGAVPNDPGSSGASSYNGTLDDTGTIAVDVLREASDRGLVVVVSEQGEHTRSAAPATCAVYGNTNVACDPAKQVNREEYTLLRFLGANFVDPNVVDASGDWSVSESHGTTKMTARYAIAKNADGVLTISETRHVADTSQGSTTFDAETKLEYNAHRLVPTTIDEYATEDRHGGVTGVTTTVYQTTLDLVSDSLAKP